MHRRRGRRCHLLVVGVFNRDFDRVLLRGMPRHFHHGQAVQLDAVAGILFGIYRVFACVGRSWLDSHRRLQQPVRQRQPPGIHRAGQQPR